MKVFISQLMRGREDEEIFAERDKIAEYVRKSFPGVSIEVIDSFYGEDVKKGIIRYPVFYLGKSIEMLAQAGLAVFGPGWEKGRGTWIERRIVDDYRIPVMFVDAEDLA